MLTSTSNVPIFLCCLFALIGHTFTNRLSTQRVYRSSANKYLQTVWSDFNSDIINGHEIQRILLKCTKHSLLENRISLWQRRWKERLEEEGQLWAPNNPTRGAVHLPELQPYLVNRKSNCLATANAAANHLLHSAKPWTLTDWCLLPPEANNLFRVSQSIAIIPYQSISQITTKEGNFRRNFTSNTASIFFKVNTFRYVTDHAYWWRMEVGCVVCVLSS